MTHTKKEYQAALDLFNHAIKVYDYEPDIEAVLTLNNCEIIRSALQLAIDLQPKPIDKLRLNSSGPNWDFSDPVLFRSEYKETGIVNHDVGRVMIDNMLNKAELPDNKYLQYDRITHFYDISALPKPQEGKD